MSSRPTSRRWTSRSEIQIPVPHSRSSLCARSGALVAALVVAAAATGTAAAAPLAQSQGTTVAPTSTTSGVAAAPVTSTQVKTDIRDLTGESASKVTTRDVCGSATPGSAQCQAEVLVNKSSGQVIAHPQAPSTALRARIARPHADSVYGGTAGTPGWLQQAYDLTWLSAHRGVGQTVGVIEGYGDPTLESDLATYRANWGLPACTTASGCLTIVNQTGGTTLPPASDPGWELETAVDTDAVSATCPNCHIIVVQANDDQDTDLAQAEQTAINLGATVLSESYGGPSTTFDDAQATGVPVFAASGDDGAYGDVGDYPSSLPGVTAIGGTSLALSPASARGFSESAWAGSSSGCNLQEARLPWQRTTGCKGRAYVDVSADADPYTGISAYSSVIGGWFGIGGTSLAAPLTAGYAALTGVAHIDHSSRWAYADGPLLNDVVSGSNFPDATDTCPSAAAVICTAQVGWDGPTGNGSISGDVVTGGPGIGAPDEANDTNGGYLASIDSTSLTLTAGIYANGLPTTYYVQYGATSAYGSRSLPRLLWGTRRLQSASISVLGLRPSTTYHYRIVAQNALGTEYSNDEAATTSAEPHHWW